jgi:hypothetical protein
MEKPVIPPLHGHQSMEFEDQPNTAGEARLKLRKGTVTATIVREGQVPDGGHIINIPVPKPPAVVSDGAVMDTVVQSLPIVIRENVQQKNKIVPKSTKWYRDRAEARDIERAKTGEAPLKRYRKYKSQYCCLKCSLAKTKETGHTQYKGKWWCPTDEATMTLDEWKSSFQKN